MTAVIAPTFSTARFVANCTSAIWDEISSVAFAVWIGKRLYFGSDHREAPSGLAGSRGLDGGVERQQVGLAGNAPDEAHDLIDMLGSAGERSDRLVCIFGHDPRRAGRRR